MRNEFGLIKQQNQSGLSYNNVTTSSATEKHSQEKKNRCLLCRCFDTEYAINNYGICCNPFSLRKNQISVRQLKTGLFGAFHIEG